MASVTFQKWELYDGINSFSPAALPIMFSTDSYETEDGKRKIMSDGVLGENKKK